MVMDDVHVNSVVTAGKKCRLVLSSLHALSDSREDECSREDGLQVPSGHLQDQCKGSGDHCHEACTTFNTPTPLVNF